MIVGALRVKNEGRWLGEVLDALKPVCRHLFVFDDRSTDDTVTVAKAHGGYVIQTPFDGLNEARDKTFLSRQIINFIGVGHWVLMIDGDFMLCIRVVHVEVAFMLDSLDSCASLALKQCYQRIGNLPRHAMRRCEARELIPRWCEYDLSVYALIAWRTHTPEDYVRIVG